MELAEYYGGRKMTPMHQKMAYLRSLRGGARGDPNYKACFSACAANARQYRLDNPIVKLTPEQKMINKQLGMQKRKATLEFRKANPVFGPKAPRLRKIVDPIMPRKRSAEATAKAKATTLAKKAAKAVEKAQLAQERAYIMSQLG